MSEKKPKVVKKAAAPKVEKSLDQRLEEEVDKLSPEEAEEILDPGAQYVAKPQIEEVGKGEGDERLVKIKIPVQLKIKRKLYPPGIHTVPRHLADTMVEMVDKKRRADLSIFVGKNHLIERLLDRTLVVHEVESLDMNKIVRK